MGLFNGQHKYRVIWETPTDLHLHTLYANTFGGAKRKSKRIVSPDYVKGTCFIHDIHGNKTPYNPTHSK